MNLLQEIDTAFTDYKPALAFHVNFDAMEIGVRFVVGGNTEHDWDDVAPSSARTAWNEQIGSRVGMLTIGTREFTAVAPAAMDAALELFEHLYTDGTFTKG